MMRTVTPLSIVMIGQKGLPAKSGGIERHVGYIAHGLADMGHDVTVYARRWYTSEAVDSRLRGNDKGGGLRQVFTRGISTKHLDAITHGFTALLHARTIHPDVIHLHGSGIALLTPVARVLHPHARVIVTFHCIDSGLAKWGMIARNAFRLGERFACWFAHDIVTVSQVLAKYCVEKYGRHAKFVTHAFTSSDEKASAQPIVSAGFVPQDYFLMVARLIPDKQAHVLVDAYAEAKKRAPELFAHRPLVIIGDASWTNGYARMLRAKVRATDNIFLLGERVGEEVRAFQEHAFAHVFPSGSEGMPFSLIEAGASGRVCIATNLPQHIEALGDAFIPVESGSVSSLADALCSVATMSHEDQERMGMKAKQRIRQRFSPEDRIRDLDAVYQESVTHPVTATGHA